MLSNLLSEKDDDQFLASAVLHVFKSRPRDRQMGRGEVVLVKDGRIWFPMLLVSDLAKTHCVVFVLYALVQITFVRTTINTHYIDLLIRCFLQFLQKTIIIAKSKLYV